MQQCPVCGRTYGLTHECAGPSVAKPAEAGRWAVQAGFAPANYFRQALAIAALDDSAVVAASRDRNAMLYGAIIWVLGQIIFLAGDWWAAAGGGRRVNWVVTPLTALFTIMLRTVLMLGQYGLCHLLARWWFGARGTYLGVLRALLLGSVVLWLGVIPYVGGLIARLWSIAVMMIVFEDVDGIERLKAFGLSLAIGLAFWALVLGLAARFGWI